MICNFMQSDELWNFKSCLYVLIFNGDIIYSKVGIYIWKGILK